MGAETRDAGRVIFIDRSIPKSVAEALQKVRDDVEWLEPRFDRDAKDFEWLRAAGAEGWLCITRDKKIRTRPMERDILIEHRVGCFYVMQKQHPSRWDFLKLIVLAWDQMHEIHAVTARPYLYGIGRTGVFRRII